MLHGTLNFFLSVFARRSVALPGFSSVPPLIPPQRIKVEKFGYYFSKRCDISEGFFIRARSRKCKSILKWHIPRKMVNLMNSGRSVIQLNYENFFRALGC